MNEIIKLAPIKSLEEFVEIRDSIDGNLVITSGGFDPIHPGHIDCIIHSKRYGDVLGVVVNGDNFLRNKKGAAFMNLATRCKVVAAIRGVDFVIPYEVENDQTVCGALSAIQPDFFTKGGDYVSADTIPEWDICIENDIDVITGVGNSKSHSSSDMLENWYDRRLRIFSEQA